MKIFTILIMALVPVLTALVAAVIYLRIRVRNLALELASAQTVADEWGALLALEHHTNYLLACKVYGQAVVGRAIKSAHDRGVS